MPVASRPIKVNISGVSVAWRKLNFIFTEAVIKLVKGI
ncbi:hypothetical protein BMETH_1099_2 [methanotrophic bacterial endosymbiont of Bathymodiolus sp.]|nr:hypothetical protein BMETH_1099_2 [methanotrophic bacterial endosymbiont of Bathymodiolus sp.]